MQNGIAAGPATRAHAAGIAAGAALVLVLAAADVAPAGAQDGPTRLLRQPTVSATHVAFGYGGDLWTAGRSGGEAKRLTATPAHESDPHFSPDGRWIAFTSDRTGTPSVYVVSVDGGDPRRLVWHPAASYARGWTPDGRRVLYASERDAAPTPHTRLWTVPVDGGPAEMLPLHLGYRGDFADDGRRLVVDRMDRWDVEFRNYRGGQNTPLVVLDTETLEETHLPNERTTDTHPVWVGGTVYFLSDRDDAKNVWAWDPAGGARQVTRFTDADVKHLAAAGDVLALEQAGWIHLLDPATGRTTRLDVTVRGDFPWARAGWEDVTGAATSASLSPTGKRALFQARGEVFTVPADRGDVRNLTRSAGVADRNPIWSPDGTQVAWFSDAGDGYELVIAPQDGLGDARRLSLGESKYAWEPAWSPDGSRIAFIDERARIRVLELATGRITVADVDGNIWDRQEAAPVWSPDSKYLAYSKVFPNNFRRIVVWSLVDGQARPVTDPLANAITPAWDRGGKYLYFLASTNLGLGSAFANITAFVAEPTYAAYLLVLDDDEPSPFPVELGDEPGTAEAEEEVEEEVAAAESASAASPASTSTSTSAVRIDFPGIERRVVPLPGLPVRDYPGLAAGPENVVFIAERIDNQPGVTLHRYDIEKREGDVFLAGTAGFAISADGKKMLVRQGPSWRVVGTAAPPPNGEGRLAMELRARVEPEAEWRQIFEEALRLERDFFYDPGLHGADWAAVRRRYEPLIPFVRHRGDLSYILDQIGGELAVGHSFVFGGDLPAVDTVQSGLLGADLVPADGRWRIERIYTAESWNPELRAPLDEPGLRVDEGDYILAIDGEETRADDQIWRLLEGRAGRQTVLRLASDARGADAWTIVVTPIASEVGLRQRAWVEDNRRRVDELSGGRLAYVWVPNTGGNGFVSFNRYFFSQQDREGAVIDERFNGGGSLDDYMVLLMNRKVIAGVTNDANPGGPGIKLPMAGVAGPKVLLVNELAGSGGDYFPYAFQKLGVGPLIGARTWGGLVASCVPYPLIDGGAITSPCSAIYDEDGWVAEGVGIHPDIEVIFDAKSVAAGRDPQLERGVREAMRLLEASPEAIPEPPPFPRKARYPR